MVGNGASPIPLIDLAPFTTATAESSEKDRREVVEQVEQACREIGFFAIRNHGVQKRIQQDALHASRDFFDLSTQIKLTFKSVDEKEYPYGYENSEKLALGKQTESGDNAESIVKAATAADLKETFSMGPSNPQSGMPARRLPKAPETFEPALSEYYGSMEKLAALLLSIFAQALGLPDEWFAERSRKHFSALRVLNYFPIDPKTVSPGQLRAGAHTDYGPLTILLSGGPGLQVQRDEKVESTMGESNWVDVPVLEDVFIINLGDLMARWTNGKAASLQLDATHRSSLHVQIDGDPLYIEWS